MIAAWQEIETAPKDDRWLPVARFDASGDRLWWERARWSEKYQTWRTSGGYCEPTHWFVLPERIRGVAAP